MPEAFAPQGRWSRGIVTYLIYVAAGTVSLALSTPSDTISLLYLAAGFGLACVLCWGRRQAIAVGLGSLTVGIFGLMAGNGVPTHWGGWLGLVASGVGGGLQTWAAARWVQGPDENAPMPLDNLRDITRFMLLAGPLACVINPVLTSTTLVLTGATPYTDWLPLMASWWAGDMLGVLMGTPLLLTLWGRPERLWRQRRFVVGMPLLASSILLGLGIRQIQDWDQEREDSAFRLHAEATSNAMRLRLNAYLAALESMRGIYDASDSVERDEFRRASSSWLRQLPGTQALGWTERLSIDRLPTFEQLQRSEGVTGFRVFDQPGRVAPHGPDLVAIRFIEPLDGNEAALGLNILSLPLPRQTYQQAILSNQPAVSPGLKLTQEKSGQLGVVIYRAVYRSPNVLASDRSSTAMGVVFLALRMDDALVAVLKDMPPFMQACLLDRSEPGEPQFLGGTAGCGQGAKAPSPHTVVVPLSFAQREWSLRLWAVGPVPSVGGRATAWLFAIGGVGFAAALGTLLLMVTGHAERMTAAIDDARLQRAAAESANQAKSDFLSRMSHELRTPLNAILGFAQVMGLDRKPPLSDAQRHRLDQIQQAGWHLLDMIDDVLDLSRIDAGTLKLTAARLPLPPHLEATSQLVEALARQKQVSLTIDGTLPAGWGVLADETRFKQVLTNLLSNAVKYNRPGGSVHVQAALLRQRGSEPPMVNIVVTDTGLGMSEAQLAQLFQPFNRLGREKNSPDGTGIGLVISRHLALLMNGQLEATSREGTGSTFTLTLPAATLAAEAPPAPAAPPRDEPPLPPPGAAGHEMRYVLYVEDNDANTAVVQAALSSRTWVKLTVAATIEAGLAALHDRLRGPLPQLILLDVHLPDASGLDFLKLAKANPETQHIPVVMISADALPEQIDNALKAGAAAYLTKPLQIAALLSMVDDLLKPQLAGPGGRGA